MLFLIGIKRNVDISVREKLNVSQDNKKNIIEELLKEFNEAVILNTCNRCEIYIECNCSDSLMDKVIKTLNWNIDDKEYLFMKQEKEVVKHLFEVSCGLHSKIKGEDQILGQVRNAYMDSVKIKGAKGALSRLFENAINCGKTFRSKSRLYEIPVSIISIIVNKMVDLNCSKIMVLGYGKLGKLAIKYLIANGFEEIYLALRNVKKADDINNEKVKVVNIKDRNKYINLVDGIISCTSAPEIIINKEDINEEGGKLVCFDAALPRDISKEVEKVSRVKVYNIDEISKIDDENKIIRNEKMNTFRYIIDERVCDFMNWYKLRSISDKICKIKDNCEDINKKRVNTIKHKGVSKKNLVETMIRSTSNVYLNRAVEILKEETLKGREEECLKIIERIFAKEIK